MHRRRCVRDHRARLDFVPRVPLAELEIVLAVALLAVLAGGLVHGTLGVGFPLVATPIIALATDLLSAILLTLIPTLAVNLYTIARGGRWRDSVARYWPVALLVLLGAMAGSRLLVWLDPTPFKLVLAGVILLYLLSQRSGVGVPWIRTYPVAAGLGFGIAGGLVAGITNVTVPVLIIYFGELGLTTVALVQVLNLCFLAGKLAQITVFHASGRLGAETLLYSAVLAVPAVTALLGGGRLRDRMSRETYLRWLRRMLFVIAVALTVQTLPWFFSP